MAHERSPLSVASAREIDYKFGSTDLRSRDLTTASSANRLERLIDAYSASS